MLYAVVAAAGLAAGSVIMIFVAYAIQARNNRRRRARRALTDPPRKSKIEFSKLVLGIVMLLYFVTVGVGIKLSLIDYTQFSTLAMLVGAPTATAIGFYAWKAKAENVVKIKQENPQVTEGVTIDPSNII